MAGVSTFVRDGKAFLKDASGNLTTHDPSKVGDRILSGRYTPATADDVRARDAEKTSGLAAFGEAAAAGAYDAAVAPATIPAAVMSKLAGTEDPTAPLSGRAIMRELAYLGAEATGGEGAPAANEYEREARLRAEAHPVASAVGQIGGSILGGLGISGGARSLGSGAAKAVGSELAGTAVAGAVEGAALGGAAAREEAFIKDEDLTAESVLAGMGWGALVGGGLGIAMGGGKRLFGRQGSRGATELDAPAASSAKLERPMEESAERILGQPAAPGLGEKLRDAVEGAQTLATGAERDTLSQYGALRWDSTARRGRALWRNREGILEGATSDITSQLDDLVKQSRSVMDEVVDSGLKREHVASKLAPNPELQIAAAREEAARLRSLVDEMAGGRPDFSDIEIPQSGLRPESFDYLRSGGKARDKAPITFAVEADGSRRIVDGRHRLILAKEAGESSVDARVLHYDGEGNILRESTGPVRIGGAPPKDFGNKALLKRMRQYIGGLDAEIQKTDDAASAFIALDKSKRGLQRWAQSLRESARMSTDALKRQQAFALGDELAKLQEGTRQMLMDDGVWGAAAADQRTINAAWEKFFESKRMFDSHFVARTGVDFEGRPIVVADPRKVSSYVRGLGKQESALVDQHFRAHVQALDDLTGAIGGAFDLGPKAQAVEAVRAANKRIRSTLASADETVKVANQIDAVLEAERGGGGFSLLSGAFGGGMVAGMPGLVLGLGAGLLGRPGQMIRQLSAVEVMAQNLDGKLQRGVSGFFKRSLAQVHTPKGLPAPPAAARPLATVTALDVFRGKETDTVSAYRKKVAQLDDAVRDYGSGIREKAQVALGSELPQRAPKMTGKLVATATRGAMFLQSKRPEPSTNLRSLTPNASRPVPSDYEISKFARYWNTVANPMSAVRDLENGTLTHEQVETLRAVYPRLYRRVQEHVMAKLREADAKGIEIPYQAKLQLDLLLNLNGAGEPTATPDFMLRFQEMQQSVTQQQAAAPRPQPIRMSGRYASARNDLEREL